MANLAVLASGSETRENMSFMSASGVLEEPKAASQADCVTTGTPPG